MSSSAAPCAACKCLRRKCTEECPFAPYFPADQQDKFINVHKVFGASNVSKLINELAPADREYAVTSLAYEADCRLKDPVYGCVGMISVLQQKLTKIQHDLHIAKHELATYIGPSALEPRFMHMDYMQQYHPNNPSGSGSGSGSGFTAAMPYNIHQQQQQMMGFPTGMAASHSAPLRIREPPQQQQQQQQQQIYGPQQFAAATYEHQPLQQQLTQPPPQEFMGFGNGYGGDGPVTATTAFNPMTTAAAATATMSTSLALGSHDAVSYNPIPQQLFPSEPSQSHQDHYYEFPPQSQIMLQQQQQNPQPQQPQIHHQQQSPPDHSQPHQHPYYEFPLQSQIMRQQQQQNPQPQPQPQPQQRQPPQIRQQQSPPEHSQSHQHHYYEFPLQSQQIMIQQQQQNPQPEPQPQQTQPPQIPQHQSPPKPSQSQQQHHYYEFPLQSQIMLQQQQQNPQPQPQPQQTHPPLQSQSSQQQR